eukprot:TRINITY_DN6761_c0_g1_i1.p1 TRINITY_DN6761_c0_g1~~TRINITY_DN6761_c0_g1_i1.p1  ORF type:complete len:354 (-),score=54.06 TRINITY_DN6761_c0_g1_i1:331-1392(-)
MLRSLVGSEMCIRDSINAEYGELASGDDGFSSPCQASTPAVMHRSLFTFLVLCTSAGSRVERPAQETWEEADSNLALSQTVRAKQPLVSRQPVPNPSRKARPGKADTPSRKDRLARKVALVSQSAMVAVAAKEGFVCSMPNGCNLPMEFPKQKAALERLYQATDGPNWVGIAKGFEWKQGVQMCDWSGVTCDPWGRVVKLNLNQYGLKGQLPPELAELTSLSFLDLGSNLLSGSLPSFTFASNLTYIYLNRNRFSGSIPRELPRAKIKQLVLSSNLLSGAVPKEYAKMTALSFFDISNNRLTSFPDSKKGVLDHLKGAQLERRCDLRMNLFRCPLPKSVEFPAACGGLCGDWV